MSATTDRARRTGPRELSVDVTPRYRLEWILNRLVVRALFDVRVSGLERWPDPPFQVVANHHNGFDPMIVLSVVPLEPRITWFGPKEADFSRGFKNRVMGFFGGMIPYNPEKTTLTSAVRAVRRVFAAGGVLGIFAEGRIGFRETGLLDFEEGAAAFAIASGVPIVPCAIVGSTDLWFRKRVEVRFGAPIPTERVRGHAAREAVEERVRAAITELLPRTEPRLPRRRALPFLTDLLNGADDIARRREGKQREGAEGGRR
ncbi:MAG TPA: lysophospholipid acyltransferase family protein [Candidatus Limnocylindria bacterium]|nr:lysophospholipid acyltransferase family protein [Candidatus Limnocylindria bacterium]